MAIQASAQDDLASKLQNPVADLVSVPFQNNFDYGHGEDGEGFRWTMNFQPVIPVKLGEKVNMINRIILPVMKQNNIINDESQGGIGDVVASVFFSPQKEGKVIWGIGPVFLVPTASASYLGTEKFGIGPTVVLLYQKRGFTTGLLANHINSVAGKETRTDVNASYFQPFLSYTFNGYSPGINAELTQDWKNEQFSGAINFMFSKTTKLGKAQPISLGGGVKYFLPTADTAPTWGFRFIVTFIFPKAG